MEAVPQPADSRSHREWFVAVVLVLFTFLPIVVWPGDVSLLIDESRLLANAFHANRNHELAAQGLYGNFGLPYSPVPTHIYQLLVAITHDPFMLVVLRGLLASGLTAFSLLWLARSLRLPPWFAAVILIGPNVIAFHRILWDASFTIPLGSLTLAAFADFLRTGRVWPLRIALAGAVQAALIHPQTLPLSLPIIGHLVLKHRDVIWRDKPGMSCTAGVLLIFNAKYLVIAAGAFAWRLNHAPITAYPNGGSHWLTALAPLLGGNLLTGYGYSAPPIGAAWLATAAAWCSRIIFLLIWSGIALGLWRTFRPATQTERTPAETARDTVTRIALIGLALQALIFGVLRIPAEPQYFFGTFALHVFFAWLAVQAVNYRLALRSPAMLHGAACACITFGMIAQVHWRGDPPTLKDAVGIVHTLNRYDDTTAWTDVELFRRYPEAIRTVRLLLPAPPGGKPNTGGRLLITARKRDGLPIGGLEVAELHGDPPPGSRSFEITPLPGDWMPDPGTW